ncbi:DNA-processing protein DprA [Bacillus swezeyi]|uniref:DNA-processing protein DprA n=1 Tax=Bacillus swezeyi TaxID=1925020 RepID=UPI003F8C2D96
MLRELLILKYLNINGSLINFIAEQFSDEEKALLFNGGALELHFKYNIFDDEHLSMFYDDNKLKTAQRYVDTLIEKSREQNIKILSYYDDEYPAKLKAIKKSPLFIHVKGNVKALKKSESIACVGARTPSRESIELVKNIVGDMVKEDILIISGLAKGIDSHAHKVCLSNGGKTIAIMAHGLDTIYPKENSKLAEAILDSGGALISEYPLGTKSRKQNFVARNRLISGLSEGVVVFEASEKSGTMHTARFAYTQGKKIFCPTLKNEALSSGVQKLLSTGSAIPIKNASDIINQLFRTMNIEIQYQSYKTLEKISKNKGISINDLLNLAIVNFIKGDNGDE